MCVCCGACVCGCVCVSLCGVWHGLARGKKPRVLIQHASVRSVSTPPCVPTTRPHVEHMRARCRYTRRRADGTHGSVLNQHTGGLCLLSLSFFSLSSLSSLLFFSFVPSSFLLFPRFLFSFLSPSSLSFPFPFPFALLSSFFCSSFLFPSRHQKLYKALINNHGVTLCMCRCRCLRRLLPPPLPPLLEV